LSEGCHHVPIEQLTRVGRVRAIARWRDPVIHRPGEPVTDFGEELQYLLADMFASNRAAHGPGLAAPQVGVGLSAFVYDCLDGDLQRQVGVICNPTVRVWGKTSRGLAPGSLLGAAARDGPSSWLVFGDRLSNRRRRALYRTHEQVAGFYPENRTITPV
jgi:peptide deformylase